jgi:hypothetical protein
VDNKLLDYLYSYSLLISLCAVYISDRPVKARVDVRPCLRIYKGNVLSI